MTSLLRCLLPLALLGHTAGYTPSESVDIAVEAVMRAAPAPLAGARCLGELATVGVDHTPVARQAWRRG